MRIHRLGIALVLSTGQLLSFGPHTFFGMRSQAVNSVRDLVGVQTLIPRQYPGATLWHKEGAECGKGYNVFSTTLEYNRSFKPNLMREYLFGCNNCMTFSGSMVPYRGAQDILADYFGLPSDFQSTVSFDPLISNVILDFNAFWGLDDWIPGLYFRGHVPLVHTSWNLRMCENVQDAGKNFQPAGYMGPVRIDRDRLAADVSQAFAGCTRFGDMNDPLRYGKICGARKLTQLAEVHATLGWNYVCQENWHAGIGLRAALRTCGVSNAQYLFEPIVGNGGHWELGGSITSHWDFWERNDHKLSVYLDANITHLFASDQVRSYDLKNGNGSRYMLLQHFNNPSYNLENTVAEVPSAQYQGGLTPAINQTTLITSTSFGAQGDIVLKFAYHLKDWEFDLGYNFYGRSAESIGCRQAFPSNLFAIKGDAQIYGFNVDEPTPLSASQSKATIYAGQGDTNFVSGVQFTNANADNHEDAFNASNSPFDELNTTDAAALDILAQGVQSSFSPILLTDADINECSGIMPRAISNKLFINVTHIWNAEPCIVPYVCGGFSAEWAGSDAFNNSTDSQWALWVKGGITY